MKQKPGWLTRILTIILGAAAMCLLLTTPVTLKVNNFHGMIKTVIAREIKASDDDNAKTAWSLIKTTGADDLLLQKVPRKFSYQASGWSMFELSQKSDQLETQTDHFLLSSLTKAGLSRSDARKILKLLPQTQLKQIEAEISSYLHKYQAYFLIIAGIVAFSILLLLLGHGIGIWLIGLLNLVLFVGLLMLTSNAQTALQTDFYRGIQLTVDSTAYLSLLLSLAGLIIWHFGKKKGRQHD